MYNRISDIRKALIEKHKHQDYVTDKTGSQTIEIVGASFIADEPYIFGAVNDEYVQREINWYLSQSLYVKDLGEPVPKIWTSVSSNLGKINSNYGYLIYNEDNYNQAESVIAELINNRDSRRAVMIYTRPSMHTDYNYDGMSDFICTNAVQYLIRNNRLDVVVQMRSNDVVYGYRNDYAWQKFVQNQVVESYNLLTANANPISHGNIIWQVGSLHVYSRHFNLIK